MLGFHGGLTGSELPRIRASDYPLLSPSELDLVRQQISTLYDHEAAFFNSIGFNPALLNESLERTKLASPSHIIEISVNGKLVQFPFDQQEQAQQLMRKLNAEHQSYNYHVISSSVSPGKFYFPNLVTMKRYGISGIKSYPYPESLQMLEIAQTRLSKKESLDLELVGDF